MKIFDRIDSNRDMGVNLSVCKMTTEKIQWFLEIFLEMGVQYYVCLSII